MAEADLLTQILLSKAGTSAATQIPFQSELSREDIEALDSFKQRQNTLQTLSALIGDQAAEAPDISNQVTGAALTNLANFVKGGQLQQINIPQDKSGQESLKNLIALSGEQQDTVDTLLKASIAGEKSKVAAAKAAATKTKDPTTAQFKAARFALTIENRFANLEKILADKEFDPLTPANSAARALLPEFAQSQGNKKFSSAILAIANAILRPESGAAIPDSEVKNKIKELIPTVNDGPEQIKSKLQGIRINLGSLMAEAGPEAIKRSRAGIKAPKTDSDKAKKASDLRTMSDTMKSISDEINALKAGQ